MRESISKFNITRNNSHLLDIFFEASYLELGNIHYQILERMLNYELINLDDISYYSIQNNGLGKSNVISEELKKLLPFLYFDNLNTKNKAMQLFITYGLLKLKDQHNRELFSPIILIPINLYFDKEKIFIQQISRPVENPLLISFLSQIKNINVFVPEKLDNLFSIDKFCMGFERHGEFNLKLENFLTFAYLKENEIKINHDKFIISKKVEDYLYDKLYSKNFESLYYSTHLNRLQRMIVQNAYEGNNVIISGRLGTGKTTSLINIAINAIEQDKRVLYVSNMKETLEFVNGFFEEKQLNTYVTNFNHSFASFHQGELIINTKSNFSKPDYEPLQNNYKFVNDYESAITNRILGHRFIDILNHVTHLSTKDHSFLDIDDMNHLYKHDLIEIIKALEEIESAYQKIDSFKYNVWKDVPIINAIKYPNQVVSLIYQINKGYNNLHSQKQTLQTKFGFKEIYNYAFLKTVIHNFSGLNIYDIPSSWKEETYQVFNQARDEYRVLKNDIYQLKEMEYFLNHKYDNIENINIDDEINFILGDFFTENDLEKIDKVMQNRMQMIVKINKSLIQIDIFLKSIAKISNLLNWNFDINNRVVEELIRFNSVLHRPHLNLKVINILSKNQFVEILNILEDLYSKIEKDREEFKNYTRIFPKAKSEELDSNLDLIEKYHNQEEIVKRSDFKIIANLKKNQPNDFNNLLNTIKKYRSLRDSIAYNQEKFFQLIGFNAEKEVLEDLKFFQKYLESLPQGVFRNKIVKFLFRMCDVESVNYQSIRNNLKSFELLKRAYHDINHLYKEINSYEFLENQKEIIKKIADLKSISAYLQKAFASNDRIYIHTKSTKEKYIHCEEYFKLKDSLSKIMGAKTALKNHSKYHFLFQHLYHDHNTNINQISRLLQSYTVYIDCFDSPDKMLNSLEEETHQEIIKIIDNCRETVESLNHTFTLFFKLFKDDVSQYYYDSFENNIAKLNLYLNSKDDLISYLTITDNLQILNNFKLVKLIGYITNNKSITLVDDFKYTYFSLLKEQYLEKYSFLNNFKSLEACLKLAYDQEEDIILNNEIRSIRNIKRNSGLRFSVLGIKNLDYKSFVKRTSTVKKLFLSTTQIVNNFLNINDYDVVIIDDAHLLSANEYYYAIEGKQVIVSGEFQSQSTIANNLISRMRNQTTIHLNYRYLPTPKNLLLQMKGLKGLIKSSYQENFGIEIVSDKLMEYISLLYKDNNNYVINLFTSSYAKQKEIYDQLSDLFYELGFSNEEIVHLFRYKINISDLSLGYIYDADYNIIFMEDYFDYDVEYIVTNMIDNLMLCRRKLIIYDYYDYLNEAKHLFVNELNRIVGNEDVFKEFNIPNINEIICKKLQSLGYKTYNSENELSFIIEKNQKLFGVILFWDDNNINYETLNEYRDYVVINNKNDFKIILIWSIELSNSLDGVVEKIIMEINDD